jgi:hypothetical protein
MCAQPLVICRVSSVVPMKVHNLHLHLLTTLYTLTVSIMIWLVFPLRNIISILGLSTSCIELSINDLYWGTSVEPQRAKIIMEEYVWILQLSNKELKIEVLKASQFLKRAEIEQNGDQGKEMSRLVVHTWSAVSAKRSTTAINDSTQYHPNTAYAVHNADWWVAHNVGSDTE